MFMSLQEEEIETSWCDWKGMKTAAVWFLETVSPSLLQHRPFTPWPSFFLAGGRGGEVNNLGQKGQMRGSLSLKPPGLKAGGRQKSVTRGERNGSSNSVFTQVGPRRQWTL